MKVFNDEDDIPSKMPPSHQIAFQLHSAFAFPNINSRADRIILS